MVTKISNNDLSQAKAQGVAVLDFSATWCGPCQPVPPLRLVSSIGRGSSMVLFPLLHFRLFCAKYNTQMDAKETHSPPKNNSGFFRFFVLCIPFASISVV